MGLKAGVEGGSVGVGDGGSQYRDVAGEKKGVSSGGGKVDVGCDRVQAGKMTMRRSTAQHMRGKLLLSSLYIHNSHTACTA